MRRLFGCVQAEGEGGFPAVFLNAVTADEIRVWGVKYREGSVRFYCAPRDYRRLKPYAKRACMRMRVRQKRGIPFALHRVKNRRGLWLAGVLFAGTLLLLSTRIWAVEVVGNTATSAETILSVAEEKGVRLGASMRSVNIKGLEIDGLAHLPTLSWITVNPSGCVARVEVTERKPAPPILDLSTPSDMIALRDGVVLSQIVISGQSLVQSGEGVKAGQMLISGTVASEEGEGSREYRALGEIMARTERCFTVSVPLDEPYKTPGKLLSFRTDFSFLCWRMSCFASGEEPSGIRREEKHFLTAGGLTLPLGFTHRYIYEEATAFRHRTPAEAKAEAERRLMQNISAVLGTAAYEETARKEELKNGVYTVTVNLTCRENIATEVIRPVS